jgi:D-alanyl-D-alanine carboxypeptidase
MRKSLLVSASLLVAATSFIPVNARAIEPSSVATIFTRLISNKELANPSVVVIDEKTGEVVFEKSANSLRKPASVQKIFAGVAAVEHLPMDQSFTTSAWVGTEAKSLVIQGSLDPWISLSDTVAKKMGRTSLPRIEFNSLNALKKANSGSVRNSTIYYSNLYSQDVANLKLFFAKHGVIAKMKQVNIQDAIDLSDSFILESHSPQLQDILAFTLTWSDNLLAERIARLASKAAGNSFDDAGVAQTFANLLTEFNIDSSSLVVQDASGLSRDNRVTAKQVGQLLVKIHHDPRFAPIINGLPIGGETGTLKDRFITTAPSAIGLVRAKTGTLNGTANLAGYVESGSHEYVFVIIADRLRRTSVAEGRARATVDRILGKIASPLLPQMDLLSDVPILNSDTP